MESFALLYHAAFLKSISPCGPVSGRPYSPRLYGLRAGVFRLRRKGPGCNLSRVHDKRPSFGKAFCVRLGSMTGCGSTAWQRRHSAAPLVQRGDSMAGPCRGDCKARQMIQLGAVTGCGSTAWQREHRSPPCAKGGQHGKAMQGGLAALSCLDDTSHRV